MNIKKHELKTYTMMVTRISFNHHTHEVKSEPYEIGSQTIDGIIDKLTKVHATNNNTGIYSITNMYDKYVESFGAITIDTFANYVAYSTNYHEERISELKKMLAPDLSEYSLMAHNTSPMKFTSGLSEIHLNLLKGNMKSEQQTIIDAVSTIKEVTKADAYYMVTLNNLLKRVHSTLENFLIREEKCKALGLPIPENEGVRPKWADGTPAHYFYDTNEVYTYDLSKGEFPLTTYRPQAWKNAIKEILWIYQDQSNDLNVLETKYGIKWWEEWNIGDKTIGARYGATVKEFDLLNNTLNEIKNDPMSRRNIMDMLQYKNLKETPGLFPCCYSTTWNVRGEYLDVLVNQRSSDFATAWSINQIQYVALQMMLAKAAGLKPGKFTHVVANVHIYDRHLDTCEILAGRTPTLGKNPILKFEPKSDNFYEFSINDFSVEDYEPHPEQIKLEIAI